MRYQTRLPPSVDRDQARRDLAPAHDWARRALAPADPAAIIKSLTMVADMLQCSMPEPDGIELYVAALQVVPTEALRHGMMELIRTHAYPRLPYPVEIIRACQVPTAELKFWQARLIHAQQLLEEEPA